MKNVHYRDGGWYEKKDLVVSVFDLSVLRGYGIFDFLRTYNQKPFKLKEYLTRLYNSARILDLPMRWRQEEIEEIVMEGIRKNSSVFEEFNIRIVVTGGVGADSTTPGAPSLIAIFQKAVDYPVEYYEKGTKVITHQYMRNLPDAKTLNYLIGIRVLQEAKRKSAIEVIYVFNDGKIYEGTTSNIFFVKEGRLYTPKSDILVGVTRTVLLDLAKALGIEVIIGDVYNDDLPSFEEAFLTASNKEVMPVVQIDDRKVGDGTVGPITKKLIVEYRKLTA
jgi:branched-chain amino acid aminotransferase